MPQYVHFNTFISTFTWTALTGFVQIHVSAYTRVDTYQAPDSKTPLDSQYTAGERLKSEILIILDIGHSKVSRAKIMKVIFLQEPGRRCMMPVQVSMEIKLN